MKDSRRSGAAFGALGVGVALLSSPSRCSCGLEAAESERCLRIMELFLRTGAVLVIENPHSKQVTTSRIMKLFFFGQVVIKTPLSLKRLTGSYSETDWRSTSSASRCEMSSLSTHPSLLVNQRH